MLLNRSWGARGHPFAQHYSCPAFLDAQLVLQVAAVGIFFRMWSIASIAQGQALRSIGKAATSVLPPFTPMCFFFQNECASYAGRSGRTSLCSRRLAGRWFFQLQSQTCHKLVPAFAATWYWARLLLSNISWKIYNAPMKSFGQIDFVQNKNAIFQTPRNQLSAGCAPWFWKLWGGARAAVRKLSKKLNF